jgi:hypothetical protein
VIREPTGIICTAPGGAVTGNTQDCLDIVLIEPVTTTQIMVAVQDPTATVQKIAAFPPPPPADALPVRLGYRSPTRPPATACEYNRELGGGRLVAALDDGGHGSADSFDVLAYPRVHDEECPGG